ncbi:MAG: TetR/AcrR family transcriptional regulator [Gordonia sp. (in: high G+C Gram-positive bacteria)]|jgi:AcrR family transcriptional regulator|nr:TetR/AcrR family transcriptional regulator [Gordonia sp. (in: high G+C Gram-positive bacteria)]
MGRPAKHDADDFIDAAISVFAAQGVRAVTLAAVADRLGATNGSVYYRFPDRASLLQAVWLRTTAEFRQRYLEAVGESPTVHDAVEASTWVVEWCRENLEKAQVLQAGPRTFDADGDPAQQSDETTTEADLRTIVTSLTGQTAATGDEIAFVMTELPLAVVRRRLQAGTPPGDREIDLVRGLAAAVLIRS